MTDALASLGLPARLAVARGAGSTLMLTLAGAAGEVELMLDRCRWVIVEGDRLAFTDFDIAAATPLAALLPDTARAATLSPDRLELDCGARRLVAFMTAAYHAFLEDGVGRDDPRWLALPQDQRDNLTVFLPGGDSVGIEFAAFLDPATTPWGAAFAAREATSS